jgi:hypothetical protein
VNRKAVWVGTITAAILVLVFANQWWVKHLYESDDPGENSPWYLMVWVASPLWVIDKSGPFGKMSGDQMAGGLIGVVALVLVVWAFLRAAVKRLPDRDAGFAVFLSGWFAHMAGGVAYMVTNFLINGENVQARSYGEGRSFTLLVDCVTRGAGYGFLIGWVTALAALLAYRSGGPAAYAPQHAVYPPPPTHRP